MGRRLKFGCADFRNRAFLALVQFEDRKKKMAAKAAETFLEGYTQRLEVYEGMLKGRWAKLGKEAYGFLSSLENDYYEMQRTDA